MRTAQILAFAFSGWLVCFVLALRVVDVLGRP
jgi:hypothetical protein